MLLAASTLSDEKEMACCAAADVFRKVAVMSHRGKPLITPFHLVQWRQRCYFKKANPISATYEESSIRNVPLIQVFLCFTENATSALCALDTFSVMFIF